MGIVIRNNIGAMIAAACDTKERVIQPDLDECFALLKAVKFSLELGLSNIILEGDALGIIHAVNKDMKDFSWFGHIIETIRHLLARKPS